MYWSSTLQSMLHLKRILEARVLRSNGWSACWTTHSPCVRTPSPPASRTRQLAKQSRVHFRSWRYNFEPRPFFYTFPDRIPRLYLLGQLGRRLGLGLKTPAMLLSVHAQYSRLRFCKERRFSLDCCVDLLIQNVWCDHAPLVSMMYKEPCVWLTHIVCIELVPDTDLELFWLVENWHGQMFVHNQQS